jgi:hypothetical protein
MAVSRVQTSSILQGFPKSRSLLAGNAGYDPAATWLIQRITAAGGETSFSFTGIPQTYTSLQIRGLAKDAQAVTGTTQINFTFNGDSGANYGYHWLNGNGTSAAVSSSIGNTFGTIYFAGLGNTSLANMYGTSITDIQDYASTTKNKTTRSFSGGNGNLTTTNFRVALTSNLWLSTAAITSITLTSGSGSTFIAGSTFALYGMK